MAEENTSHLAHPLEGVSKSFQPPHQLVCSDLVPNLENRKRS